MEKPPGTEPETPPAGNVERAKSLEAAGWGLVLLWLGITSLFTLGWPAFLIGLGVIALGMQGLRSMWQIPVEGFWLILGVIFIVAGVSESFGASFPFVPVALILFGLAALYDAYKRLK